jgi:hypothetical protein
MILSPSKQSFPTYFVSIVYKKYLSFLSYFTSIRESIS